MIATLLILLAAYFVMGFLFAIPFVLVGVKRIDPHATHGSWGFRALIIPGSMFLWPLLAKRLLGGPQRPPEEKSAHRRAARGSADCQSAVSQAGSLQGVEQCGAVEHSNIVPSATRRHSRLPVCATPV